MRLFFSSDHDRMQTARAGTRAGRRGQDNLPPHSAQLPPTSQPPSCSLVVPLELLGSPVTILKMRVPPFWGFCHFTYKGT